MAKKFTAAVLAAILGVALLAPTASAHHRSANVVDALVARSSLNGPDNNGRDFDVLIAAASNVFVPGTDTSVAAFLAGSGDITLWAPRDRAFVLLARDLGYPGRDEGGAASFLLENVDNDTLFAVLAYHVTPESYNVFEVLFTRTFETLQGQDLTRSFLTLRDADPDARNPRIGWPLNIRTSNDSVIHSIDRVLRPIDLP